MDVLSTCTYVHHMSTWCPQNPKRASDPLELESQVAVNSPAWVLGINSGLFPEHQVLLTTKATLVPRTPYSSVSFVWFPGIGGSHL